MNNRNPEEHVFSYDGRKEPPTTELLQERILKETNQMPQQSLTRSTAINSHARVQKKWLAWRILPVSGAVALILCVAVLSNGLLSNRTETVEPVDISSSETNSFVSDDLAWQDVMLMHDELAFLDL